MRPPAAAVLVLVLAAWLAAGCNWTKSDTATAAPSATAQPAPATEPATTTATPATSGADGADVVGLSVQGRPIRARSYGSGPRKVLFIGGIHGDETEGAYTTDELPAAFEAAGLADTVTLTILEDANPDGRAVGTRTNVNGVDVNRNFPASNYDPSNGGSPLSQPEARAVYDIIARIQPALVLVAHSWSGRQFINFDGPAREIAQRFSGSSGMPVEESSSFASTPGSLGSYFGRDRGIAILTIELLKGSDPQADWEKIRDALLQAIAG